MKILIDDVLKEQNRTRYNLSILTNVNYMSIKKLCDGDTKNLSITTLDKISTALQVPIERLIQCEEHSFTLRRLNDEKLVGHRIVDENDAMLEVAFTKVDHHGISTNITYEPDNTFEISEIINYRSKDKNKTEVNDSLKQYFHDVITLKINERFNELFAGVNIEALHDNVELMNAFKHSNKKDKE